MSRLTAPSFPRLRLPSSACGSVLSHSYLQPIPVPIPSFSLIRVSVQTEPDLQPIPIPIRSPTRSSHTPRCALPRCRRPPAEEGLTVSGWSSQGRDVTRPAAADAGRRPALPELCLHEESSGPRTAPPGPWPNGELLGRSHRWPTVAAKPLETLIFRDIF